MGLDSYLSARRYISGYNHDGVKGKQRFDAVLEAAGLTGVSIERSPSLELKVTVGYWRKANAIHKWFVANAQDGKDECQESEVSREQLQTLLDTCTAALSTKDATLLPPSEGFFFGGTEADEYYWEQVQYTADLLLRLLTVSTLDGIQGGGLDDCDFMYQASW